MTTGIKKNRDAGQLPEPIEMLNRKIADLEQSLTEYEKKNQFFEMLIRSLPGLFYLFDENFRIYKWNKNVEKVTGYSAEEIPSANLLELFKGEDVERMQESIRRAFATGEGFVEAEIVNRDNVGIPYFFTGVSARIEGTSYLIGMGTDISARKQAEDALRESEALYRIFAERMAEGVALCQNSKIVFVNNTFIHMFEYPDPESLLGRDLTDLVTSDFEIYFQEMVEALEKGLARERFFQARWVTRTEREIWVEGRGNLIQWKGLPTVLMTARDITEAKLREISMGEEAEHLRRENLSLRSSMRDRYRFGNIIGKSSAMQEVYELILDAAGTSANVIIYGESGTGKELVARAIHDLSSRAPRVFVTVNCAAIPENLVESEFFGHKKGAFTGAHADRRGYLDLADGGTLFLDEVGELGLNIQAKLLRAIEAGGYLPVGSNLAESSDFRIIAATNRNLLEQSRKGLMREDFFYRIHIIPITLPPLRARKDDIPLLVEHFLRVYAGDKVVPTIPGQVMETLNQYDWPGNVRELQNVVQRYLVVRRLDFLTPQPAMQPVQAGKPAPEADSRVSGEATRPDPGLRGNIAGVEKAAIREALARHRGNKSRAAEYLGISRKTLTRKLKRFGPL